MKYSRYQSINFKGHVLHEGNTLSSIQFPGDVILIDYKLKRFNIQCFYPVYRPVWNYTGLNNIPDLLQLLELYSQFRAGYEVITKEEIDK